MTLVKDILKTMEYGPAPEGAEHVLVWLKAHEAGFGHFINGRFTKHGAFVRRVQSREGRAHRPRLARLRGRRRRGRRRGAQGASRKWAALSGHERAKHLYALARHIQKRERFLSVLESLDNGKPIRESRDIDVPLVARHFYHHAGWAQLVESEFPGTKPVGVVRADHPVELPAADARLEDRAGARRGQHGRAEARRISRR